MFGTGLGSASNGSPGSARKDLDNGGEDGCNEGDDPIVVDKEETAVSDRLGEELEIEENEIAIPIPAPGRLVPIEDKV